jgi:PAS domain S-box-containing protein
VKATESVPHRLAAALAATSSLNRGLRLCLDTALKASGLDAGGIYILAPQGGGLVLKVHRGLSPAFVRSQKFVPARSPYLTQVRRGRPIYSHAGRMLSKFSLPTGTPEFGEGLKAVAAFPILARRRLIGSLNLASHKTDVIVAPVRRVLESLAAPMGLALMRLQAEESVRLSEAKYRKLIDGAGDAIFIADVETGLFIEANRRAVEMTGRSLRELLGMHFSEIHPRDQGARYRALFAKHVTSGSALPADGEVRHKSGRIVPVEISSSLLQWRGRNLLQGIFRELTERRNAEKERRRSHEALRRLAAELAETQENERSRIARELHDTVGQTVAGLAVSLNQILGVLPPAHDEALRGRLQAYIALLEETTTRIRRVISDLRPPLLDEYGLSAALAQYAREFSVRSGLRVEVWIDDELPRLKPNVENALFRIVQEALANAHKHAGDTAVALSLETDENSVHLLVRDEGRGFDPDRAPAAAGRTHWGLSIMKERALGVGGLCRIVSAPGSGTQVIVEVPR